ncbi:hypothetical protein C8A01DRAFT_33752 [Parachaetomium inaequale]|uniref:Zn(2)-C6 fungal-type domain-containing protein n=1 Tax=Parachaetomium inaequale TaxID=2588326 RepID=A0AAN6PKA3_9PEZI|nr:hypothetical protein C8A01DRAFT_33752 [Parachaetomium inaequale]
MSASSSSPAASPETRAKRPQHNCLECKRLKRACDKGFPCGKCVKANRICEYKDPCDDGVFGPISAAKDINSLAFGTLLDILVNKPRVKEAVALYFDGVNTWFTIVERATFERDLEANWGNLSAETSAMALCMALIARPPNQKSSKGLGDTVYLSTTAILKVIRSRVPMSIKMLQAELLVAMYEFSHSMPQQAYSSLGSCLQMTKVFGWHNPSFWSDERRASKPGELKLCSILWWAIVYIDGLLNVAYQDQAYPMNTADLAPCSVVPLPEVFDQPFSPNLAFQFGGQAQALRDANSDHIDGIVFPEATSAWYLSNVLQQLSNPTAPGNFDSKSLSDLIWQHALATCALKWRAGDRNAAVGTDFIALMKLNHRGLFGAMDPIPILDPNHAQAAQKIRLVTDVVHGKAGKLAQCEDQLSRGAVDPCWAFAMCYAALLLIAHGDDALHDADWFQKVANLRIALDKVSKRWKIAEQYCERVTIALDNRLTGYAR